MSSSITVSKCIGVAYFTAYTGLVVYSRTGAACRRLKCIGRGNLFGVGMRHGVALGSIAHLTCLGVLAVCIIPVVALGCDGFGLLFATGAYALLGACLGTGSICYNGPITEAAGVRFLATKCKNKNDDKCNEGDCAADNCN